MRFKNKVVVVTGASSGMGRKIALDFAKEGALVVVVARRVERLEELKNEAKGLEGKILPYPGDISKDEVIEGMIDFAVKEGGKIDVLVNNAGIMDEFKPVAEITRELYEKILNVNLYGPLMATKKAVSEMLKQADGGNIVNIASIGGTNGARAGAIYTASKHAIVGITKNTAYMYTHKKIRCNVICPGGVDTEVMDSQKNLSQFGLERVMAGLDSTITPGKVEDISAAALFLASDESKFTNGAVLVVDGGVSAN